MAIADAKVVVAALSESPGVYRFYDDNERLLYVGKAKNLRRRVASYLTKKGQSPRIALMMQAATSLDTIVTASEAEALLLENNMIKSLKPKYNILFRDDKSYPYLRLTRHPYPRLMYYRGAINEEGDYYGPFPDGNAVKETLGILQRAFQLRTCADSTLANRSRPCLLHSIGRCVAPCTNKITPDGYAARAAQAKWFMRGGISDVEKTIKADMTRAASEQRFEDAAQLRDRLSALAVTRSRHFADNRHDGGGASYGSADYIGVYSDGAAACVNIIMVRGGRRVGEKRIFPNNVAGGDAAMVADAFLSHYYCSGATPLPDRIFIEPPPAESGAGGAGDSLSANILGDTLVRKNTDEAKERLAAAAQNAKLALLNKKTQQTRRAAQLQQLASRLDLPAPPARIECFDVSHHLGEEAIASRITFIDGAPEKRAYRLFRMKVAAGGDDYASIAEAVTRCYRRARAENAPLPDLLLIDGGVGQVSAALAAFQSLGMAPPAMFGVAKGRERTPGKETLINSDGETFQLPATDSALHLIQAARDEAHRFAITAHRRRRDKKRGGSTALDGIDGVGSDKRRALITYFGGVSELRAASESEIRKVRGIGAELAARIYRALH